mgnify:CR=1 FL=1
MDNNQLSLIAATESTITEEKTDGYTPKETGTD